MYKEWAVVILFIIIVLVTLSLIAGNMDSKEKFDWYLPPTNCMEGADGLSMACWPSNTVPFYTPSYWYPYYYWPDYYYPYWRSV